MNAATCPLEGSERYARTGSRVLGPVDPRASVALTIKVRRAGGARLPSIDPRDRPLSRAAFAARYGASRDDLARVSRAMARAGLHVRARDCVTRTVRVEGTARSLASALGVHLTRYRDAEGEYRGRVGPVELPEDLRDVVIGVFGLDDRCMVGRRALASRGASAPSLASNATPRRWLRPAELAQIYGFPRGDGSGETIGLLEFGGGFFATDLDAYRAAVGAPGGTTVLTVSVGGTPVDAIDALSGEVMLDVEIASALCPRATVVVYFTEWSEKGWIDGLDAAIHGGPYHPSVLSVSYGLAEGDDIWTAQAIAAVEDVLEDAAALGITVCCATGDDGSDAQVGDGAAHVSFPASSPHVLAVGGTALRAPAPAGTTRTREKETAWKEGDGLRADGGGATGGGVSAIFPRPVWQRGVGTRSVNPGGLDGRRIPDVAASARSDAYLRVAGGSRGETGGTSAAAVVWAGLVARVNAALVASGRHRVGWLTPLLYGSARVPGQSVGAASCFDVVVGDNATATVGGYHAVRGHDCVTGWGSPRGDALLSELLALLPSDRAPPAPAVSPSSSPAT